MLRLNLKAYLFNKKTILGGMEKLCQINRFDLRKVSPFPIHSCHVTLETAIESRLSRPSDDQCTRVKRKTVGLLAFLIRYSLE